MAVQRANGGHGPPVATRFQPGNKLGGRPPGRKTRTQFTNRFIADLAQEWERSGKSVLKIVAKEEPARFMMACVALMPKQLEADIGPLSDMSDDELDAMLDHIRAQRAKQIEEMPAVIDGSPQEN